MEILDFPYWTASARLERAGCAGLLLAVGLLAGCGAARQAVRAQVQPLASLATPGTPAVEQAEPGVLHEVGPGQTLWRIARTYGLPLDELARANGIRDVSRIEAGSLIFVPGAQAAREVVPPAAPVRRDGDWIWPVPDGRILSHFGDSRRTHRHTGIDINGRGGQRVLAARAGNVVYSNDGLRGYGRTVILDHGDGLRTLYAHNASIAVHRGQRVRTGQLIARVGRTGNATTEHCHFEIRRNEVPVDPLLYLTPEIGTER